MYAQTKLNYDCVSVEFSNQKLEKHRSYLSMAALVSFVHYTLLLTI